MILVDTSVWIEFFRRPRGLDLATLVDFDEIVVCAPVVQEILQGIGDEAAFRVARQALLAMPLVEPAMPIELWLEAANLSRRARSSGITVRSSFDCLLAAIALRHDLQVLHRDRDFTRVAKVVPLRQRAV